MKVTRSLILSHGSFLLLLIAITSFHIWGHKLVPFHPDESTYLYMSSDFDQYIDNPLYLTWNTNQESNDKQRYRAQDAPLTRYLIGLGRSIYGQPTLSVDWDWSKSWQENNQAGAFPNSQLLSVSRLTITLLLPFSLTFIYLTARKFAGGFVGLSSVLILGLNTLVLTHSRRAMAEGALLFSVSFFIWSLSIAMNHPMVAGLAAALAFNSKHSAVALAPIGILAVCFGSKRSEIHRSKIIKNITSYLATFLLVTFILNPILWTNPFKVSKTILKYRQDLITRQVENTRKIAASHVLETPSQRISAMLAQLFYTPPSFAEIGNYRYNTIDSEKAYLSIPVHNIGRGMIAGSIFLIFSLFGIIIAGLRILQSQTQNKRLLILLMLSTITQGLALLLLLPLPWQRYYVPLIPFTTLWIAYGLDSLSKPVIEKLKRIN